MRSRPVEGRCDSNALCAARARPTLRRFDERSPRSARSNRFVDDEQGDLRDRCCVIERIAEMNGDHPDNALSVTSYKRARVRITGQSGESLRHAGCVRGISELSSEPRERLGVGWCRRTKYKMSFRHSLIASAGSPVGWFAGIVSRLVLRQIAV